MRIMRHGYAWKKGRKIRYFFRYEDQDMGKIAKNRTNLKLNNRVVSAEELYNKGWSPVRFSYPVEYPQMDY